MHKIVRKSEGIARQIAENKTANNLITKEISPGVSLATTKATDYYEKETTPYDRIYYVLDGELELTFDGEINKLQKGDSCFIGKDTEYEMRGTFEVAVVNRPAFGTEPDKMKLYHFSPSVILYMAISADGFIADLHDNTPWSDEAWTAFKDFVKTCDVILLGRRTYEIMTAQDEFIEGPEYIVATRNPLLDSGSLRKVAIQSAEDVPKADKVGVIGGGNLNGSLAKLGLLDELVLDIEPIMLGNGKRLFGDNVAELSLELIDSRKIGSGTIQNRYKVK